MQRFHRRIDAHAGGKRFQLCGYFCGRCALRPAFAGDLNHQCQGQGRGLVIDDIDIAAPRFLARHAGHAIGAAQAGGEGQHQQLFVRKAVEHLDEFARRGLGGLGERLAGGQQLLIELVVCQIHFVAIFAAVDADFHRDDRVHAEVRNQFRREIRRAIGDDFHE